MTMAPLAETWRDRVGDARPRIALADGADPRAVTAAAHLADRGEIEPLLVGPAAEIAAVAAELGFPVPPFLDTADLAADEAVLARLGSAFPDRVETVRNDAVALSAALLALGRVDACLVSATRPTSDVLRAACGLSASLPGCGRSAAAS